MEMMPHFSAPKRPRFALQAKLVTPIVIVLAVILLISALDIAGKNALASFELVEDLTAERLLNNARFIEHLDYIGRLSAAELMRIAEENDLFRAALYDAEGQLLFSSRSGAGWGNIKPVSKDLLARIQQPGNEELVMGFRGNRFGFSDRYIVAKLRRKGGVILVKMKPFVSSRFKTPAASLSRPAMSIRSPRYNPMTLFEMPFTTVKATLASLPIKAKSSLRWCIRSNIRGTICCVSV